MVNRYDIRDSIIGTIAKSAEQGTKSDFCRAIITGCSFIEISREEMDSLDGKNSIICYMGDRTYITEEYDRLELTKAIALILMDIKCAHLYTRVVGDKQSLYYLGLDAIALYQMVIRYKYDDTNYVIPKLTQKKLGSRILSIFYDNNTILGTYKVNYQYNNYISIEIEQNTLGEFYKNIHGVFKYGDTEFIINLDIKKVLNKRLKEYKEFMANTKVTRMLLNMDK